MRGLPNHGPEHWRGDRAVGLLGTDPDTGRPYDASLSFMNFIQAFNTLLGLGPMFSMTDMQAYKDFAFDIVMPPNPIRALDNSLDAAQAAGKSFFLGCEGVDSATGANVVCEDGGVPTGMGHLADGQAQTNAGFTCQGCHRLDPSEGFFGTDGESSFENLPQTMKVPQLRNLYDKIGMFGMPANPNENPGNNGPQGPQVRGFGFLNDGSVDSLFRFLQAVVFTPNAKLTTGFTGGDPQRKNVEQYLLAFDSDLAPIVAQQVTLRSDNGAAAGARIDLFIQRATTPFVSKVLGTNANECDLIARVVVDGVASAYRLQPNKTFRTLSGVTKTDAELRSFATTPGQEVTYTCLPPKW